MSTASYTVVTGFANPIASVDVKRIHINRNISTILTGIQPGTCDIILDNSFSQYSPFNSSGPYFGQLTINSSIQVLATTDTGSTYTLFTGYIDEFNIRPALNEKTVTIRATDISKAFYNMRVNTPLWKDMNISSITTELLSICNVSSANRTVDAMTDIVPFCSFGNKPAIEAISELMKMGDSSFYISNVGKVAFKTRTNLRTGTPVNSYDNSFLSFNFAMNDRQVKNSASISGATWDSDTNITTLAWLGEVITIPFSMAVGFTLNYIDMLARVKDGVISNPSSMITPTVATSDYAFSTVSGGSGGTDLTAICSVSVQFFGRTAVCTIYNPGSLNAFVNRFQLRGTHYEKAAEFVCNNDVTSSQNVFGKKAVQIQSEFLANVDFCSDYAQYITDTYSVIRPQVVFQKKNDFPDMIQRDLGDTIHVKEDNTAVNSVYYITGMSHDINMIRGIEHVVDYAVDEFKLQNYLVLDDPILGVLDGNRVLGF